MANHDTVQSSHAIPSSEELKALIEKVLDDNKADDIETIDLRGQSSLADFMVVASGTSTRQVASLASKIQDKFAELNYSKPRAEGATQGDWVVVDAIDVIVHIFRPEVRTFYNIEKMWRPEAIGRATTAAI